MPKRSPKTAVRKRCAICRRFFIPKRSDCTTCSDECKAESHRISRLKYERRNRVERTRKMRERRQAKMKPVYESGRKTCRYCGRKLNKKRPNKEYCNGLCRQRMYRALANGEKIPAGMSETERREMLKRLESIDAPDLILAPNDNVADGIISALIEKGCTTFPAITGQDLSDQAKVNIKAGKQTMTIYKEYEELARNAATIVNSFVLGSPVSTGKTFNNGAKEVPSLFSNITLVTKDNIDKY